MAHQSDIQTDLSTSIAASIEPVSIEDMKAHCRIDDSDWTNDSRDLMTSFIKAATNWAQEFRNQQFIEATLVLKLDEFPDEILLRGPVSSVTSIGYTDENGDSQTLSESEYQTDLSSEPARITPAWEESWPTVRKVLFPVTVTYVAGYGTEAKDVPQDVRVAIKQLVAHWWENRESSITGTTITKVPQTVEWLLWPERVMSVP